MQQLAETFPDFSGKYMSITKFGEESRSVEIEDPLFENLGGRIFITGIAPRGSSKLGWLDGVRVSIAWEQVLEYYVFDDAKTFAKAIHVKASKEQRGQ
ncbi:MAG: hypothetical protein ACPGUE_12340 [Marinomonas sp.]